jgi:hypothetical protein
MSLVRVPWVTLLLSLAACGGTAAPVVDDAGADATSDGAADTGSDAANDGGTCVPTPKVGTPCVPGQVACDKVIGCCSPMIGCNATTKQWEVLAVGCACQSFACGDKQCGGNEVCRKQFGGIPLPDGGVSVTYSCVPYPSACERQQTCDCLKQSPPAGCTLAPQGCIGTPTGNTVECMGS